MRGNIAVAHLELSVLVGLLLWNYFLCVNTDPGRVPEGWVNRSDFCTAAG
jgi:hypothetical protein